MEKLTDGELRLMEVLWDLAPINSTQLVAACKERLSWSKSTTYTVLRRLVHKGAAENREATVTPRYTREEVLRDFRVRMAAPVVPDVTFEYQEKHDLMIGKAFDCRLGCASILRTLDNLRDKTLNVDVTGAFAVQEEMGTRGATVTANTVKPDLAIVFEGCPADDTVAEPYMIQTAIHKGPMLRHIDARMITNPRFQRYALDLAEELGIPVQESVRTGGSTNGAPIHLSNQGVPVIVIGIPVRYIHTHYGIAAHSDVENAARLAAAILERMDAAQISRF